MICLLYSPHSTCSTWTGSIIVAYQKVRHRGINLAAWCLSLPGLCWGWVNSLQTKTSPAENNSTQCSLSVSLPQLSTLHRQQHFVRAVGIFLLLTTHNWNVTKVVSNTSEGNKFISVRLERMIFPRSSTPLVAFQCYNISLVGALSQGPEDRDISKALTQCLYPFYVGITYWKIFQVLRI